MKHVAKMAGDFTRSPRGLQADVEARIQAQAVLAKPVTTYAQLRAALAARRRLLGLCQLEVDAIAGLPSGYCGKLEVGMKGIGNMSFECLLGALGLELYVVQKAEEQVT